MEKPAGSARYREPRVVSLLTSLGRRLPGPIRRPLRGVRRSLLSRSGPGIPRAKASALAVATHAPQATPVARAPSALPAPAVAPTPPPAATPLPAEAPAAPARRRQSSRLETRREFVFRTADRAGRMLEIGPAHNAILPKRDGFNSRIVDYLDRAGLVNKYREFEHYSPDDIEDVDYVLAPGASMAEAIPDRFDLVLASHVLEHTISMIDFINDCTRLLAPGGVLSLVVPDHRYCFDRFRERSSLGRVIDVSLDPPRFHTVGTVTEFTLNAVKRRGTTSWRSGHVGTYSLIHEVDDVVATARRAREAAEYIDVHNWIFSPNHLRLLIEDLHALGYITVREAAFQDTIGHEFFLNLQVGGPGPGLSRAALLVLADAEATPMDRPEFEPAKPETAAAPATLDNAAADATLESERSGSRS